MARIGVFIFTDKAKERGGSKDFFEAKKNFGINKILSQLNEPYDYCSTANLNNYEYVLISITSYYDILNLVRAVPPDKKCKIVIGGPGVNNIRGYIDIIDYAWFGRCDHGEINDIVNGKTHESLWIKENDKSFTEKYIVCAATIDGLGYQGEKETSIGCCQKCRFCHYSWWNKYIDKNEKSYKSGFTHYEDFFQAIDWSRGRVITARDGMTEKTRKLVSKPISYEKIKEKILETNMIQNREKNITAKIYNIIGYPWEEINEIEKCDITRAFNETHPEIKNNLLFYFHLSHFVPMQKTPMWWVHFNFNNYWKEAKRKPMLFQNDKIKLMTGTSTTGPATAATETIIQRALNGDYKILKTLSSKKWNNLSSYDKINVFKNDLMRFFVIQKKETIENIITTYEYQGWDYE